MWICCTDRCSSPLPPQVQKYLWMQDSRNLKLEPLCHIVFFFWFGFLLACKNSDALVFTVSLYLFFVILEVYEYTVDTFELVFEMIV